MGFCTQIAHYRYCASQALDRSRLPRRTKSSRDHITNPAEIRAGIQVKFGDFRGGMGGIPARHRTSRAPMALTLAGVSAGIQAVLGKIIG